MDYPSLEKVNKSFVFDNFFYDTTKMESPKKLNDCYFYYYSTCNKGDNCTFRHEPSALGCETVCSFWKEGKCVNVRCSFRHMELRKNRKAIQCYWEQQPGGCLKPHCPFHHQNPKSGGLNTKKDAAEESETQELKNSLVVNLEEESDDSTLAYSPEKSAGKSHVKSSLMKSEEEMEVERIQREDSAQYYSHYAPLIQEEQTSLPTPQQQEESSQSNQKTDLRLILSKRQQSTSPSSNLKLFRKRKFAQPAEVTGTAAATKKVRLQQQKEKEEVNLDKIVVKTLAEIYAERSKSSRLLGESEVSSTSDPEKTQEETQSTEKKQEEKPINTTQTQTQTKKVRLIRRNLSKQLSNKNIATTQIEEKEKSTSTNTNTKLDKQEDVLLLDEDEDMDLSNDAINNEDDILKNIDELLGE